MVTVTTFADQHKKQAADLQAQLQQLDTQVGILTKQYAHTGITTNLLRRYGRAPRGARVHDHESPTAPLAEA